MSKPFQFSTRRMFLAVTCFALSAAMIGVVIRNITPGERMHDDSGFIVVSALSAAFITIGAAVGAIVGRTAHWATVGAICAVPALTLAMWPVTH